MAVDSLDDCGIYFGATGGQVYCSPDGGDTWNAIVRDLPAGSLCTLSLRLGSPLAPREVSGSEPCDRVRRCRLPLAEREGYLGEASRNVVSSGHPPVAHESPAMARLRCLACQLPMTADEAAAGVCPSCEAQVDSKPVAATPAHVPPTDVATPGLLRAALWGVMGLGLFAFVCWMIIENMPKGPEPKKDRVAEAKKVTKPTIALAETTKDPKANNIPDPDKIPDDEPIAKEPPVPMKTDPKETAKETPKKEPDPKKDEPKVVVKENPPKGKEDVPPVPPQAKGAKPHVIPFAKEGTIRIDGDLTDWKDTPPLLLHAVQRAGRTKIRPVLMPETQIAHVAWTGKGLLIGVDAIDTSGLPEASRRPREAWGISKNDAVEVFVDTLNARPRKRQGDHLHHFVALPFGATGETNIGGYEAKPIKDGDDDLVATPVTAPQPIVRVGKKTIVGWSMEMLIPRSAFRPELKPGNHVGFELQLDTGTHVFYLSSCKDPQAAVAITPSVWGEAVFGGTDGTLEILNMGKQPTQKAALGQTTYVRVVDADHNLNPNLKESIEVTLKTRSGTTRKLTLEETNINTGVFVGGVIPKLKAPNEKAFINVEEDDAIAVEYIEAARANGDRNVVLRSSVTTGIRLK
ncbi:MAG: hypothetical protein K2X38_04840 [Gemmataceae bacterium]|nr:hypothetical protein [Gemmataceae bacterium]